MKFIFSVLFLIHLSVLQAQTSNPYLTDIKALYEILKKTPSFKDQITGQTLIAYNELYERLKADSVKDINDYKYFYNLAQLFFPIRDNHLGFYQFIDQSNFKDTASLTKYLKTEKFKKFPKYNINTDSLKEALRRRPLDSVEGIYYLDTLLSIGLFKARESEYIGVVLESKINYGRNAIWEKGQIAIHLYEHLPNQFKAIYADPITKQLFLFSNEKFRNLSLINSHFYGYFYEKNYTKLKTPNNFTNLPRNIYDFNLKYIDTDIQYLHIKHFSANPDKLQKSIAFYDSIKHLLTAQNLIVDIRNNEGGSMKASNNYLKLLKQYSKNGCIYILVNNGTISQGEIFTLQLKQLDNVKVLGQTTNGTLMYGSNYGKKETLPSNAFQISITDMDGDKRLMPYEVFGITPDITLSHYKDWIEQVVEIIRKK